MEADFRAFRAVVTAGRWLILSATLLCCAVGGTYAFLATPWYQAQVSLLPTQGKSTQGLAGQLGPLSGLASLAGISVGGGEKAEPLAFLRSRNFVQQFIESENLMPVLYSKKWDKAGRRWRVSGDSVPDVRDAVKYFDDDIRTVGEDRKNGLVILTINWEDPVAAANWANWMAARLNAQMRERAIADAQTNIAYLRSELSATTQIALQQSISKLLETQLQNMMLARGEEEFSFRIVDKATVPKYRVKPKRLLIVVGSALLGALLSLAYLTSGRSRKDPS